MIALRLAGGAALRALAPPGRGSVLAVFRRSLYLERSDGALACLGPPALGPGPLNALCDLPEGFEWEAQGVSPGLPFMCEGGEARAGGAAVSLREARPWRPSPLPGGWTAGILADGLEALGREANPPAEGMGGIIPELIGPPILRRGEACLAPTDESTPFRRLAWPAARILDAWLAGALRGEAGPPPEEAENLIGLGPGLTPSGDDFIGGMLIALRALGEEGTADRLAGWALPLAARRTGKISLAHLACAAGGEGNAALHGALAALCQPGAPGLAEALAAVGAIGHTSGWDALAGAAAACAAWTRGAARRGRPRGFEGRRSAPV